MRPPRLARWLLRRLAPPADRAFIVGDLQQEFEARGTRDAEAAARWYWRQVLTSARPLIAARWRERVRRVAARRVSPAALATDTHHAARWLLRHPRTTGLVVTTLGVALAATLAAFMVIEAIVLRPLPFPEPDRIVQVDVSGPTRSPGVRSASLQDVDDWRLRSRSFDAISAYTPQAFRLTGRGAPREVNAQRVGRDFHVVLGLRAVAGRLFEEADFTAGGARHVVLAQTFWAREFASDPHVVGTTLLLDEAPWRIVGVVESTDAVFPGDDDLWVPLVARSGAFWESSRGTGWVFPIGRMRRGIPIASAEAELSAVAVQLGDEHPRSNRDKTVARLTPVSEALVGPVRQSLLLLGAALAVVLLIACANLATLLLASASRRRAEFAVRTALGAARGRLARQVAMESLVLALMAVAAALALAPVMVRGFLGINPTPLPRAGAQAVTAPAALAVLTLAGLAVLIIGLPQIAVLRRLEAAGTGPHHVRTIARGDRALGFGLIAAQVALSVLLVVAGTALVRTMWKLQAIDPGYRADGVLVFAVTPSPQRFETATASMTFYRDIVEGIRTIPGVAAAAAGVGVPLTTSGWRFGIRPRGADQDVLVSVNLVSAQYFDSLGIRLTQGRFMTDGEQRTATAVAVVNERLARILDERGAVVGRTLNYSGQPWTIVGVVEDVRQRGPKDPAAPELFIPWHMAGKRPQAVVVRSDGDPMRLLPAITARVHAVDPSAPLTEVSRLSDRLREGVAAERFRALLLTGLAVIAAALAALGGYSVTAYAVARRTREFGIRLALGERARRVYARALWTGLAPALTGLAAGCAGALGGARLIEGFLYDVRAGDARVVLLSAAALLALATISASASARRATRVDPMVTLRAE